MDYDEPWYDQTNEETFRPWTGSLPVSPAEGMLLVRAVFECADGSRHPGFSRVRRAPNEAGSGLDHQVRDTAAFLDRCRSLRCSSYPGLIALPDETVRVGAGI